MAADSVALQEKPREWRRFQRLETMLVKSFTYHESNGFGVTREPLRYLSVTEAVGRFCKELSSRDFRFGRRALRSRNGQPNAALVRAVPVRPGASGAARGSSSSI